MENLKNLGNNIAKLRKKAGITQERLAEQTGVSVSAVSQWEGGKTMPDICTIPTLCHVLNVSSDELLEINRERMRPRSGELMVKQISLCSAHTMKRLKKCS